MPASPTPHPVRQFFREAVDTGKQFGRECLSTEGKVLLGYTLVVATHHWGLEEPAIARALAHLVPASNDWLIRKDLLDLVFFGGAVLLLIGVAQRQNPLKEYGLKLPDRRWITFTGAIFAVQLFGILIASRIPSLREYYPMFRPARGGGALFWEFQALAFLSMVAWEFLNRGYLLFGLKARFGLLAVLVQTVPFMILHFGKPTIELYWSIFDGIGLGLLAYASGSIWPAVWLHGVGAFLLDFTLVYIFPTAK